MTELRPPGELTVPSNDTLTDAPTDPVIEHLDEGSRSSRSRTSRRALLLAGTAVVATACNPLGGSDETASETEGVPAPDELTMFDGEQALVDDGEGNTTPDNQGPLIAPGDEAEATPGASTTETTAGANSGATSTTTRAVATTAVATTAVATTAAPTTAAPTTTTPPTTAAPTTAAPTTAAPTTAAPTTTTPPTTAPPTTVPPPPPPAATARLMTSRLTFGITPEVDQSIVALGINGWVEDQLSKSRPDPAIENLFSSYQILNGTPKQAYDALRDDGDHYREITHAQIVRARYSSHQLFETMTHLWMDHFNISFEGSDNAYTVAFQEQAIRPNAMGRFVDLLVATAESGSMMEYLDNTDSDARRGINENYGRELLELHTLGIDENGNQIYSEEDVVGAAHVMSGWAREGDRNSATYGQFRYRPEYHSTDAVSLLGGQWTNAGLVDKAAGDSLLQFLARHPQTANYIAFKLCRRFVADSPPAGLVSSAAAVYLANDTALVPVLRHIFNSTEFAASGGQKVRRPFELLSAAMRSLGTSVPMDPQSDASEDLIRALQRMGHQPWRWETPDGYPDEALPWVNSTALLLGWEFTSRLARNELTRPSDDSPLVTDISTLRGNAATAGELFDRLTFRCNLGDLPVELRDALLSILGATADTPAADIDDDDLVELTTFLLAHPLFLLR
jgi:uncharacterized protein (DUF1800 family)